MDVIDQIRQGDIRATARLMRDLDEGDPQAREVLKSSTRTPAGLISWGSPGPRGWARAP